MLIPSVSVSPVAFVFVILSVPARSTKWNLDDVTTPTSRSRPSAVTVEKDPPIAVAIFK